MDPNQLRALAEQMVVALKEAAGDRRTTATLMSEGAEALLAVGKFSTREGHSFFFPGEPVFIIRARDNLSNLALVMLDGDAMYGSLSMVRAKFADWRVAHPDLCKEPD